MKSLHLAAPDDIDRLTALVGTFHAEAGIESDDDHRRAALTPLLDGSPHGAVWLIGPRKAPVGYIALSFGWSIAAGGMEGRVDELFIRPAVRGRGMGSEALDGIVKAMRAAGLHALHLSAPVEGTRLGGFFRRARFHPLAGEAVFTRPL